MEQLWSLMPEFWEGFKVTLLLLVVSGVSALILGTLIAAMRISPVASLRAFAAFWVEIARNTPLTLVFIFTAFVLPMLGVRAPYIILAFIALTYYTSPFIAEALRSGINGVPIGQAEAARAIGLDFGLTMTQVVLPQAFRSVIPPLMSVLIALLKNTTVAAGFSVAEAGTIVRVLNERGENSLIVVLWVALVFVVLVTALSLLQRQLEKKWRVAR